MFRKPFAEVCRVPFTNHCRLKIQLSFLSQQKSLLTVVCKPRSTCLFFFLLVYKPLSLPLTSCIHFILLQPPSIFTPGLCVVLFFAELSVSTLLLTLSLSVSSIPLPCGYICTDKGLQHECILYNKRCLQKLLC